MSKLRLIPITENNYEVDSPGGRLGAVTTGRNPFHRDNCYITLRLDSYDKEFAKELFDGLRAEIKAPLQIMLDSDQREQIDFVLAAGFVLKRKCYEAELTAQDLHPWADGKTGFREIHKGERGYEDCCQRVFAYYGQTHRNVSRLTASYEAFCEVLPETVLCDGEITHLAFVELDDRDYEIAYVHSSDPGSFPDFAGRLLHHLAGRAVRVSFECDDCDGLAMALRGFVKNPKETSCHTYILE